MKTYCPVCSWGEAEPYLKKGETELVRCTQCTLVRRYPLPRAPRIEALDSLNADGEDERAAEELRADFVVQNVRKFVPSGNWLDVGCGTAQRLVMARKAGFSVRGVEQDEIVAHNARKNFGLEISDGDLFDASFPPAFFNVVTLWHELDHTSAPLDLLAEVQRVLKPGGYCLIEVQNIVAMRKLSDENELKQSLGDPTRALYFSPVTARAVAEKAGFAVQEMQTRSSADYAPHLPAWKKAAKSVLSRVGLPELIGVVAQK